MTAGCQWNTRVGPHPRGKRAIRRGMSVIELLVVMGIIAFLIALLLPSLAVSRKNAILVLCANNQKHLGTAIHTYAIDHNQKIPYGPKADPSSIADFYVVDGMVTSQISLLNGGQPVGIGLLLRNYVAWNPEILFCPDADQPFNADRELERFGTTQAVSGYFYRHGSNTLESLSKPPETWDDHIRLPDLGMNRNGERIKALLLDQNFVVNPPLPQFNVITRTNHELRRTNALFADGSVMTLDNSDGRYTADIGNVLQRGPDKILAALEWADQQ